MSEAEAEASVPRIDLHTLDVSFDAIPDPEERSFFLNLPTSFLLPAEAVDRLREIAGRLLRDSVEHESLVRDLGGAVAWLARRRAGNRNLASDVRRCAAAGKAWREMRAIPRGVTGTTHAQDAGVLRTA